jgi:hypothetical protein
MRRKDSVALGIFLALVLGLVAVLVFSGVVILWPLLTRTQAVSSPPPQTTVPSDSPSPSPQLTATAQPETTVGPAAQTPTAAMETPTSAPQPPPASSPGTGFDYGIQVHLFHLDTGYVTELVNNMHFNWIKHQIEWKEFEPSEGQLLWKPIDQIVDAADVAGLNVMLSVVKAPDWARGGRTQEDGPPVDFNDYGDFMGAMAQRYCGKVQAYEIWNEQNLRREWNTGRALSASEYVNLLRVAHGRIKAVCPSAIVVSGGPTPVGYTSSTAIDDLEYLRQMYQAGLKNYCDAVGVHPSGFSSPPDWRYPPAYSEPGMRSPGHTKNRQFYFLNTIEGYHNIMSQFGDGGRKLWATEFGWASIENLTQQPNEGYEYAADNTELEQARYLLTALQIGRQKGYMGVMFIWNLNFAAARGAHDERAAFGILREDWSQRPAYQTLAFARTTGELP